MSTHDLQVHLATLHAALTTAPPPGPELLAVIQAQLVVVSNMIDELRAERLERRLLRLNIEDTKMDTKMDTTMNLF